MTERLYYSDPYLTSFDASVVETVRTDDGRVALVLDRTAFYPTSGGQPFDTGALGAARVLEVLEAEDGRILHVVDREESHGAVHGVVDWGRRFEHMQQHTGQHVLSAAFDRLSGARTVSFHLGTSSSTIDLERQVTADECGRAEAHANAVLWEDRPVTIRFADAEEASRLALRKESGRSGQLRLIDIDGFDLSACGGTHVARTGAIGIVLIVSTERVRGGTRIEFVCGVRALREHERMRTAVTGSVRHLSVLPAELPEAIQRLQSENRDQKRRLRDLETRVADQQAIELAAAAEPLGRVRLVAALLDGWQPSGLKAVAACIVRQPDHLAVLLSGPVPFQIVVARSANLADDAAALLRALTGAFGGKGGGRPELAQGGGLSGSAEDITHLLRTIVRAQAGGSDPTDPLP
ncbi:MAG TPA: alanyl-tRNA editing protein [Vicinamibacterales bacterium]|nr:alanyl-tRNA editing protein [Vicinamibacterales bacterium]